MEELDRLLKQSEQFLYNRRVREHLPLPGVVLQAAVGLLWVYLLVVLSQSSVVGNRRTPLRNQSPSSLCTGHPTSSK